LLPSTIHESMIIKHFNRKKWQLGNDWDNVNHVFGVIDNRVEMNNSEKEFHNRLVISDDKDEDIRDDSDDDSIGLDPSLAATPSRSFSQRQVSVRRTVRQLIPSRKRAGTDGFPGFSQGRSIKQRIKAI
jgi:hypothetical protein